MGTQNLRTLLVIIKKACELSSVAVAERLGNVTGNESRLSAIVAHGTDGSELLVLEHLRYNLV